MIRSLTIIALTASSATALAAPTPDPGSKSSAVTPKIVEAVVAEMDRSQKSLTIPGAPVPYYFAYKLTEVEVNDVAASLGWLTGERDRHFVSLEAHVHVGSYVEDNSNFVATARDGIDGVASLSLPLEATPILARRAAWRATDAAYKEAIEQLSAKKQALKTGASGGVTDVPSHAKLGARVALDPVLVPALETNDMLGKRAAEISAFFRGKDHIRTSRVAFTSFLERRWLINSEGTRVHDTRRVSGVLIAASSQASDGQELSLYYTRYGITAADLPSDAELLAEARNLSDKLAALQAAPLVDNYAGPILFEGDGAADMVRHTLARNLSGTPLPVGLSPDQAQNFGGGLITRIGLKVTAPWLTVIDDPTTNRAGRRRLIGGYGIDDEGVKAARVEVVSGGRLKALLMSRTPNQKIRASNGHARLSMPGGVFRGSPTNTFVSSGRKLAAKALEKELLAAVKEAGLPYGLIVSQLDDPAITSQPELDRFAMLSMLQTVDNKAPPAALLAYRLYPNGKRELVRGVQLEPVDTDEWKDLIATGRTNNVKNFLASTDDPVRVRVTGIGDGFVPSAGIESAVITPDILFEELGVRRSTVGRRPAPLLSRP